VDIETGALIEKIAKLKYKPISLSGYVIAEGGKQGATLLLYPRLDPGCYYVIDRTCIVDIRPTPGDERGHVTVLLDAECELECVCREHLHAADLRCEKPKSPCGCKPSDDVVVLEDRKDELRNFFIAWGRFLLSQGIDQLDCGRWVLAGGEHGCCQAINGLLRDLKDGGEGFDTANYVLAGCAGIG
jgi:hypothetical protein